MKHMQSFVVVFALFVVAALSASVWLWRRVDHRIDDAETKVHRLCAGAKDAMRQDATAFESGDAAQREEAYQRFYEGHALYHSAESLLYCVDKLPEMPLGCQLNKDWACLAKLARQIQSSLP